jgi:hypothetical protein
VVAGSYLLGPMSVPSNSRNFTSIGSFPPAIFPGRVKAQDPNNRSSERWQAQSTAPAEESREEKLPNSAQRGQENRCGSHEGSAFSFS